jgi:uncharacterized protein YndB with AHSA1/START domain
MTEPLRLSFDVACDVAHAFSTWTERTSSWWPPSHTVAGELGLQVIFEPVAGGRIFERAADGREADWGRIVAWDPPRRLVYEWHLRQDRADATEVEIRFDEAPGGMTRVTIEHRGWDRLGERGPDRREANKRGWAGLLPHYQTAV